MLQLRRTSVDSMRQSRVMQYLDWEESMKVEIEELEHCLHGPEESEIHCAEIDSLAALDQWLRARFETRRNDGCLVLMEGCASLNGRAVSCLFSRVLAPP